MRPDAMPRHEVREREREHARRSTVTAAAMPIVRSAIVRYALDSQIVR